MVELKNDLQLRGTLLSVDQYLNIKLDEAEVEESEKYPHLVGSTFYHINVNMIYIHIYYSSR